VCRVLAGCNQSLLPTAASRRYSENLSLDAGPHTPAARRVPAPVSSTASSAFPHGQIGSASRVYPANDFSQGILSRLQVFRNVPASKFCSPPRSFLPLRILPQGSWGFYIRAYRALSPPHAPDMLTARRQAIGGTGTCTPLDSHMIPALQALLASLALKLWSI